MSTGTVIELPVIINYKDKDQKNFIQVWILTDVPFVFVLPLISPTIVGNSPNPSDPRFPQLQNGNNSPFSSIVRITWNYSKWFLLSWPFPSDPLEYLILKQPLNKGIDVRESGSRSEVSGQVKLAKTLAKELQREKEETEEKTAGQAARAQEGTLKTNGTEDSWYTLGKCKPRFPNRDKPGEDSSLVLKILYFIRGFTRRLLKLTSPPR